MGVVQFYTASLIAGLLYAASAASTHANETSQPAVKTIIFSGSQYYPPLEWTTEDGSAQGFISDLERAMADVTDHQADIQLMQWNAALQAVLTGDADAVPLIASERRSAQFDFTQPFFYVAHAIFARNDGPQFTSLEQLANRRVAVARGAYAEDQFVATDYNVELVFARDELNCLEVVTQRLADACVEVATTSRALIEHYDLPLQLTSPPFWPQPYAFGVRKGNTELLDLLNSQLAHLVVTGKYQQLSERWASELEWQQPSLLEQVKDLAWLISALLVATLAVASWGWLLRREVQAKTAELSDELKISKNLQQQVAYAATHDDLTGLLNRKAFFDIINNQLPLDAQQRLTIVVVKIANIDSIITTFGYTSAVNTVKHFAQRLQRVQSATHAHFGSGLFGVITSEPLSIALLVEQLATSQDISWNDIEPSPVYGVASLTQSDSEQIDAAELVRHALTALAHARKRRIPFFEYTQRIEPNAEQLQLLDEFHKVGCKQFVLHYQQQLSLNSDGRHHIEALIRWQHPSLGLISPNRFIPMLEKSGGIRKVTRWVILEAVKKLVWFQRLGIEVVISVNITSHDLVDDFFVPFVRDDIPESLRDHLIFEVTERELFDNPDKARSAMLELSSMGIRCSVDDFGTGYSTLSYLHDLAVDEVKLDRLFVSQICHNERSFKIVKSTIELAHELGLTVVAEGVEDDATMARLAELNCDRIQGFLIAKPVPEETLDIVVTRN